MNYHDAYLDEVLKRLGGPSRQIIVARAIAVTRKWDELPGTDPYLGRRWRDLLSKDTSEIRAVAMADNEEGRRLRHTMPFAGILTNSEKAELRRLHGPPLAHQRP